MVISGHICRIPYAKLIMTIMYSSHHREPLQPPFIKIYHLSIYTLTYLPTYLYIYVSPAIFQALNEQLCFNVKCNISIDNVIKLWDTLKNTHIKTERLKTVKISITCHVFLCIQCNSNRNYNRGFH